MSWCVMSSLLVEGCMCVLFYCLSSLYLISSLLGCPYLELHRVGARSAGRLDKSITSMEESVAGTWIGSGRCLCMSRPRPITSDRCMCGMTISRYHGFGGRFVLRVRGRIGSGAGRCLWCRPVSPDIYLTNQSDGSGCQESSKSKRKKVINTSAGTWVDYNYFCRQNARRAGWMTALALALP